MCTEGLRQQIDNWLSWDPKEESRKEIQSLVNNEDWAELKERLEKRIAFGTAGDIEPETMLTCRPSWSDESRLCSHERSYSNTSLTGTAFQL
jgi:hypothetical protein